MLARILGGVGRTMMAAGVLILLFVAYQLWGTGIYEARAQNQLEDEFAETLATVPDTTTSTTTTTPPAPGPTTIPVAPGGPATADLPLPDHGDPVAKIRIPRIGITRTVVSGVTVDQLKRGPGHYAETPLPGQAGNAAIAGHRTTYGQPFHNIDDLTDGDQIEVTTIQGTFVYEVDGVQIVKPNEVEVLEDKGDNRITLTACHPKYSLRERIIVTGVLVGRPAPPITGQDDARVAAADRKDGGDGATIDAGLSGVSTARTPAILWGVLCALIWLAAWLVSVIIRRRSSASTPHGTRPARRARLLAWTPYLVGLPLFLLALFGFFENFSRLLPGNY